MLEEIVETQIIISVFCVTEQKSQYYPRNISFHTQISLPPAHHHTHGGAACSHAHAHSHNNNGGGSRGWRLFRRARDHKHANGALANGDYNMKDLAAVEASVVGSQPR